MRLSMNKLCPFQGFFVQFSWNGLNRFDGKIYIERLFWLTTEHIRQPDILVDNWVEDLVTIFFWTPQNFN